MVCHITAIVAAPDPDCRSKEGSTEELYLLKDFEDQDTLIEQSSILCDWIYENHSYRPRQEV